MTMTDDELIQCATALDMTVALRTITDDEVDALKAAFAALIDGKVALQRDNDSETSNRETIEAGRLLNTLGLGGASLYGDLGAIIGSTRIGILFGAIERAEATA